MNITNAKNYEEMSLLGAKILLDTIRNKPNASICIATGGSPERMYEIFVDTINKENIDISNVTFVKLDEWYDAEEYDPFTCNAFIKEKILDKLNSCPKQVIAFQTKGEDYLEDLRRVQEYLDENPLDVMILGLGMNGHLGFNEPADALSLDAHMVMLDAITQTHEMTQGKVLTRGVTVGLKGIFEAKRVLMLVTGGRKDESYKKFMSRKISTQTPASLLWLHPNCTTIIDREKFPE